jgi:dipeptidyl aminopeptidase/acylaminoacyl peptidase
MRLRAPRAVAAPIIPSPPSVLACVLAIALGWSGAAPAAEPAASAPVVQLGASSPVVEATDELMWRVSLTIRNPSSRGIYLDSLTLEIEPEAPIEERASRSSFERFDRLLKMVEAIGAGDSTVVQIVTPATAERARLTFRIGVHDAQKNVAKATTVLAAAPGPFSIAHPSVAIEAAGRKVETVFVPAQRGDDNGDAAAGPGPGLLLVHGHGASARAMLGMARLLSRRGIATMLVSMPGYGGSEGPSDFMGPATIAAAAAALDRLAASPGVDPSRLGAWGVSRGGTVVAELAARRGDLRAVVAQAGVYDLWAAYRGTTIEGLREVIVAQAGHDSAAWGARSPLLRAARVKGAVLLLHGENDPNVPVAQARAFEAALRAAGVAVESNVFTNAGHSLPRAEVFRIATEFLKRQLGG